MRSREFTSSKNLKDQWGFMVEKMVVNRSQVLNCNHQEILP
jgi:hypothetical protein